MLLYVMLYFVICDVICFDVMLYDVICDVICDVIFCYM